LRSRWYQSGINITLVRPSDLGVELHLEQPGNESDEGADDDHDRLRHRQVAGERAQVCDGHQQSGDLKLG
jgi:hypothetical protein